MASTSLDHAISARTHPSILANLHPEVRDQSAVVVLIDMLCQAEIPENYPVDVVNCKYLKHGMTGFRSKLVPQFGDIDAMTLSEYCYYIATRF